MADWQTWARGLALERRRAYLTLGCLPITSLSLPSPPLSVSPGSSPLTPRSSTPLLSSSPTPAPLVSQEITVSARRLLTAQGAASTCRSGSFQAEGPLWTQNDLNWRLEPSCIWIEEKGKMVEVEDVKIKKQRQGAPRGLGRFHSVNNRFSSRTRLRRRSKIKI